MKRILFLVIFFVLSTLVFASESRLGGLGYFNLFEVFGTSYVIDDPFNVVSIPGYVNTEYNYIIVEPKPGGTAFANTYGIIKYSIDAFLTKLNVGAVLNYPYPELGIITGIATGIPAGFLVPGTTPLAPFTITDHLRNRIDVIFGLGSIMGIKLLKPYLGFGYAGDSSVSVVSIYSNVDTLTNSTTNTESINQYKVVLGGNFDLSLVSLDANIKVYLPSAQNSTQVKDTTVQNYVNYREHKGGSIGFDVFLQPRLNLGKNYILGVFRYFNYALPSVQVTKRDVNGDGEFEEDTSITNNLLRVQINLGASYNFNVQSMFISVGASLSRVSYYRELSAVGVAQPNTNSNQVKTENTLVYLPVFVSFEVPLVEWFYVRGGFSKMFYQDNVQISDNKRFINTESYVYSSQPDASLSLGFSLKPLKDLSLDWVMSFVFINNVLVNGRLPWLISGNNFFDNVTSQVSIEYRM